MFYLRRSALFSNRMHKVRRNNSAGRCTRFAVIKQLSGFNAATLLSIYYLTRFANTHSTIRTANRANFPPRANSFSALPQLPGSFESPANDDAIFTRWRYYSRPSDTSANRRDYRARFWLATRHRATPWRPRGGGCARNARTARQLLRPFGPRLFRALYPNPEKGCAGETSSASTARAGIYLE